MACETEDARRRAAVAAANAEAERLGVHPPFDSDDGTPCGCLSQGCRERRGRALLAQDAAGRPR